MGTVLERSRVGDPVGRRGTGDNFAPWVGKVLAQVAVRRGTVYDIGRFIPARFAGGAPVRGVVAS